MPPRSRPCQMCGKAVELRISRDLTRKKFCSQTCLKRWHGLRRDMAPIVAASRTVEANAKKGNRGQANGRWRPLGSKRVTKHGYVEVKVAEPDVWRYEHRVAAEAPSNLVVHHRDGDKTNNDPANLQLMTAVDHLAFHNRQRRHDDSST
jgi:hypothetical protein